MNLERFQVDDLLLIRPNPPQRYPGFLRALRTEHGPALTLWNGNVALGAAGITRWESTDTAEAWAYLSSDLLYKWPLIAHRLISRFLPLFARILSAPKVIARVEAGSPVHARWPKIFGMEFEYGDEDGYLVYVRK